MQKYLGYPHSLWRNLAIEHTLTQPEYIRLLKTVWLIRNMLQAECQGTKQWRALSEDSNLRRAAITYGGIINAEINADANRAFSPHFFGDASKIKKGRHIPPLRSDNSPT